VAKTNLELLTDVPQPVLVPDDPPPRRSRRGAMVVSAGAIVLSGLWGAAGYTLHERGLASLDDQQLERAVSLWKAATAEQLLQLENEARVLVDDARIREPLAMPDIDDETLVDVLHDLRGASEAGLIGIVTPAGMVRVVVGADGMRGLDLSSSSLMKPNERGASTGTWVFPERFVAVAIVPVRLGDRVVANVMLGRAIGKQLLELVEKGTGAKGGIIFQQQLVATTAADAHVRTAALEAAGLEGDRGVPIAGDLRARVAWIDQARGAKVAWIVPQHQSAELMAVSPVFWGAPLALVLLFVLLWWSFEVRSPNR
jgi:hypothetical protein